MFEDAEEPSGTSVTLEILRLEEKKVSMEDANWSMRWLSLVLITIGKPVWFSAPLVLIAGMLASAYLQAYAVMFLIFVVLVIVGWYVEYCWPGWVEEYNARLDDEIQALRKRQTHPRTEWPARP